MLRMKMNMRMMMKMMLVLAVAVAVGVEARGGRGRLSNFLNNDSGPSGNSLRKFNTRANPIARDDLDALSGSSEENIGLCASTPSVANLNTSMPIPDSYNSHEAYSKCKPDILQQGSCGSCWAFATTGVLAQRMCIKSEQIGQGYELAPQALVSCTDQICYTKAGDRCSSPSSTCYCSLGCDGGYPDGAFRFMQDEGITPELCVKYVSKDGTDPLECSDVQTMVSECTATSNATVNGDRCYYHSSSDIETIQRDIMQHGPVLASYEVFEDFGEYDSGVYTCPDDGSDSIGWHAVIIVGWGVEDNTPYWLVQNSWGTGFGIDGYFKIARGTNECNIESRLVTSLVNTEGVVFASTSGAAVAKPATAFLAVAVAVAVAAIFSTN
ncbi:hypothetical protein PTSG_07950 [Salpingoeca rosetta]|uniref:Peptidase C1A papain C-terminal domain-containing protein n=1 Tax=Salpingoeca rosetta (strain ATCC 50818 / BSB-021) TaxID=946362 RepID=F2UGT1_SALR5|nr:uncharacterized protein PTSG_07950 [Salpingoeca rosetta]EGD75831.1 hypothetical protein PTSG_07950 [Salpingoeca rosetta]|eukprot:XP_004991752.1 hypothetical protein PTSG_07950 [Salpingoeca rosetta]